ncbi:MAG: hypothetical protein H3C50_08000 [Kiritimatiellae bacterium]|nr:hypothetical protein [Kiritimatiellia bacterium]MCO5069218.1 hypothetical protein [Kiritimatiellia bacterium]
MSLLLHHIKKDARHVRWLLGFWIVLVLAEGLLVGFGAKAAPDDQAAQAAFQIISFVLPVLQFLLLLVMIPFLVHDEPQVGTTAFWFTRPIPRRLLLKSKTLFILVALVLFPIAVELIVMLASHVPLRDVVRVSPEIAFHSLSGVLPIFALAALTLNFARFAITGVAIYVGISVITVAAYLSGLFLRGVENFMEQSLSLAMSRTIVSNLLLVTTSALVIGGQYRSRRTSVSATIAGLGIALMLACGSWWPYDFMSLPSAPPSASAVDCDALSVKIDDRFLNAYSSSDRGRRDEPMQSISTAIEVEGVPATYEARTSSLRTRFLVAGEEPVGNTNTQSSSFGRSAWETKKIAELFPNLRVIGDRSSTVNTSPILSLPMHRFMELKTARGTLEGEADVIVSHLEVDHRFKLARGDQYRKGSTEEVISEVTAVPSGALVGLRRTTLNRFYERQPKGANRFSGASEGNDVFYVLCNTERGEVVMPEQSFNFDFSGMQRSRHLSVVPIYLRFPADDLPDDEVVPVLDEAWLAGAELVRIVRKREGECTVSFKKDDFSLSERERSSTIKHDHSHDHSHDDADESEE